MLKELSINMLLTIGIVWSLKIENIHSRSLRTGQGVYNHCCVSVAEKMLRRTRHENCPFSFIEQAVCCHTGTVVRPVVRAGEETEDAFELHKLDTSYTTSDVDGNQRTHSIVWQTEVYAFFFC